MNASPPLSQQGALFAKIGVAMQLAFLLGIVGTVAGMKESFDVLGKSGVADPDRLSGAIGDVLVWTLVGIVFAFLGHILMAVSVGISRYRARWFFWAIVISAPLLIPSFPLGTFVLAYALVKWKEFLGPGDAVART